MIHFWNFLFDGWISSKDNKQSQKKDTPEKECLEFRLIPDGWKNLSAQKMMGLARDLTGEKYKTKAAAQRAIQKVLKGKN